jgi:hypothetical protein
MTQVPFSEYDDVVKGIPGGSSQSNAPHSHSARVSVAISGDRECAEAADEHVAIAGIPVSDQSDILVAAPSRTVP